MKEKFKLEQSGVGPGGYPEYVRVPDDGEAEAELTEEDQEISEEVVEVEGDSEGSAAGKTQIPKFEDLKKYGRNQERQNIKDPVDQYGPKNPEQRNNLRTTLAMVGVLSFSPMKDTVGEGKELEIDQSVQESGEVHETEQESPTIEELQSIEVAAEGSRFDKVASGFAAHLLLEKNQVQFLDENNEPVGEPQSFEDFVVDRLAPPGTPEDQIKPDGTFEYKLSPGKMNQFGIPEGGVAGEWLDHVEEKVKKEHPEASIKKRLNAVIDFEKALNEKDEPKLVEGIKNGEITSNLDIVNYYAGQKVEGDYTQERYVRDAMQFGTWNEEEKTGVPPVVEEELRSLMPGLCAVESKFNNRVVSKTGARGALQLMPETWEEQGGQPDEYLSFVKQVEVAGKYFSDSYWRVQAHIGDEYLERLKSRFADEEEFQRELIVPILVNSYITGASGMSDVVRSFIDKVPEEEWAEGKDLFLAIADHGEAAKDSKNLKNYGNESRNYVPAIYGHAKVLNDELRKKTLVAEKGE